MTPLTGSGHGGMFGPYPFTEIGGVVTAMTPVRGLENQTRPVYKQAPSSTSVRT